MFNFFKSWMMKVNNRSTFITDNMIMIVCHKIKTA